MRNWLHKLKWQKKQRKKIRKKCFKLLGDKCKKCGEKDWRVLQVDHKKPIRRNNKRKFESAGSDLYQSIVSGKVPLKKFQLLCANCHIRKTRKEFGWT